MQHVLVEGLAAHPGERARVMGWLHRQRRLSQMTFLILRDRSGPGQIVLTDPAQLQDAAALTPESVLAVTGDIVLSELAPTGAELHNPEIRLLAAPAEAPPLELWRHAWRPSFRGCWT